MAKIAILQSNYIPWKGYFDIIRRADVFVIYDEVQYTKNDWRNRNQIKTLQGPMWLTIPVYQENLHQKICDTHVAQPSWNIKHWNSIQNNYSKALCFKEYEADLKSLYLNIASKSLSEINITFIRKINEFLGIKTEIIDSRVLTLHGDKNQRLIQALKQLNGTTYLSGPSAKSYLDEESFCKESITIEWMDYSNYPEYPQQFPPFVHNVSVLDLILNMGTKATQFLKHA
jgi:hypothetical protein